MKNQITKAIQNSISVKQQILQDTELIDRIALIVSQMVKTLKNGGKIHFCGNGGSAADAQHLAAELSGRFYFDREPLNAEALHCNTSYLTAVANDYGYDEVYARLLKGTARNGDLLVALSTSGNSENILKTCNVAREMGVFVVGMTGVSGGDLKRYSDILLNVPSSDTPRIQEAHIMLGHILCEHVEKEIFG
jgi:D-sedoheptulose 7-phosphate isomerase